MDEAQTQLAAIVESIDDAIIGRNTQGIITSWNRGAHKLFGYAADEVVGRPISVLFPDYLLEEAEELMNLVNEGRSITVGETVRKHKDGTVRQVFVTLSPTKDNRGNLCGATVIARDITDRKEAEELLSERAHLIDSAQAFIRDLHSRVVLWPNSAEKLYGFTSKEAVGTLSHELLQTQFPEPLEDILGQIFATGHWEGELVHRRRDGSPITVLSTWTLHRNKSGRPISILENNIDITDRKRSEALLAEQARQLVTQSLGLEQARSALESQTRMLQAVLNSMSEGLVAADIDGRFTIWNSAAERIVGLTAANLPQDEWSNHYGLFLTDKQTPLPNDQNPLHRAIKGEECTTEMYIQNRGLTTGKFVEVSASPLHDKNGTLIGGVTTFRDITERLQMNEASTRLVAIVESSEDAIVGKDLSGIVTSWNSGAEKIFGYSSAEMIGKPITILLPQDRKHEEDGILQKIRAGEIVDHFETVRQRKDGKLIHVSLTISPIRNAQGAIVGASKIARDITETRKLERQLLQSQKMDAIGQLTGGIAHDFNNLLGIIIGNLDLLEVAVDGDGNANDELKAAQRAATRCADLTRRLLAFSRMEELRPASTLLNSAIVNTIALAKPALGPGITITTSLDESLPRVFVDVTALESALINLVVNARDALPKGGSIAVSTRLVNLEESYTNVKLGELKSGWYACATISDTGEGMSAETLERAFEPFFTTKPVGKGTGLGLAMVYGFAKQSGGAVRIYSEIAKGTTVSLYLPLVRTDNNLESPQPADSLTSTLAGTVMVVDDEKDLLQIAEKYLSELGLACYLAKDASSALDIMAEKGPIDLVITDIVMPGGMNGVELAQRVQALYPKTRVIYSSGFPADALAEKRMALIEGPLLHKPYQRAEFTSIVREVLNDASPLR